MCLQDVTFITIMVAGYEEQACREDIDIMIFTEHIKL